MAIRNRIQRGLWIAALLSLLSVSATTAVASVQARLDRDRMALGERVQLKIRSQGQNRNHEPDLSSLGSDFYVLGQSQSIRTTIINGQRSASVDWLIELTPLRAGDLEVPSVPVGNDSTQPLQLVVMEESAASNPSRPTPGSESLGAAPLHVTLRAEVDQEAPYVQELSLIHI